MSDCDNGLFLEDDVERRTLPAEPMLFRLTSLAYRILPRGKGAFARLIGRTLLNGNGFLMETHNGFLMHVDPGSLDMFSSLRVAKYWDDHVLQACLLFLPDHGVFYDIGANSGYISIACSTMLKDTVTVISFEPQPKLARSIAISRAANGIRNLAIVSAALSDKTELRDLFLARHAIHASFVAREKSAKAVKVKSYALDDLVETHGLPRADILKLDVEGAEMAVLAGGRRFLSAYKPTVIFECDVNNTRFCHNLEDLLSFFAEIGYDQFLRIKQEGSYERLTTMQSHLEGDFIATTTTRIEKAGLVDARTTG